MLGLSSVGDFPPYFAPEGEADPLEVAALGGTVARQRASTTDRPRTATIDRARATKINQREVQS